MDTLHILRASLRAAEVKSRVRAPSSDVQEPAPSTGPQAAHLLSLPSWNGPFRSPGMGEVISVGGWADWPGWLQHMPRKGHQPWGAGPRKLGQPCLAQPPTRAQVADGAKARRAGQGGRAQPLQSLQGGARQDLMLSSTKFNFCASPDDCQSHTSWSFFGNSEDSELLGWLVCCFPKALSGHSHTWRLVAFARRVLRKFPLGLCDDRLYGLLGRALLAVDWWQRSLRPPPNAPCHSHHQQNQ